MDMTILPYQTNDIDKQLGFLEPLLHLYSMPVYHFIHIDLQTDDNGHPYCHHQLLIMQHHHCANRKCAHLIFAHIVNVSNSTRECCFLANTQIFQCHTVRCDTRFQGVCAYTSAHYQQLNREHLINICYSYHWYGVVPFFKIKLNFIE